MHHKTKEKYLKLKESGLTPEELKAQLLADGIAEDEANVFITETYTADTNVWSATAGGGNPIRITNVAIDHDTKTVTINVPETAAQKFDYKNLTGENFKKYEEHVHSLPLFGMLDFLVYKANPVITERYPGMKDTPKDLTGITIINDTPIHKTRVDVKTALEMNAQLRNSGRYYLLA